MRSIESLLGTMPSSEGSVYSGAEKTTTTKCWRDSENRWIREEFGGTSAEVDDDNSKSNHTIVSHELERVEEECNRRTSTRGAALQRRQRAELRRDIYEAHRLIDGIHRRFPQTAG